MVDLISYDGLTDSYSAGNFVLYIGTQPNYDALVFQSSNSLPAFSTLDQYVLIGEPGPEYIIIPIGESGIDVDLYQMLTEKAGRDGARIDAILVSQSPLSLERKRLPYGEPSKMTDVVRLELLVTYLQLRQDIVQ